MVDDSGQYFGVAAVGIRGRKIDTRGNLTVMPDRLVFVGAGFGEGAPFEALSVPFGPDTSAVVERNAGQPESSGFMVLVTWETIRCVSSAFQRRAPSTSRDTSPMRKAASGAPRRRGGEG